MKVPPAEWFSWRILSIYMHMVIVIPHICYVLGFHITFVSLQLSLPLNITTDQAKRLESSVEI